MFESPWHRFKIFFKIDPQGLTLISKGSLGSFVCTSDHAAYVEEGEGYQAAFGAQWPGPVQCSCLLCCLTFKWRLTY